MSRSASELAALIAGAGAGGTPPGRSASAASASASAGGGDDEFDEDDMCTARLRVAAGPLPVAAFRAAFAPRGPSAAQSFKWEDYKDAIMTESSASSTSGKAVAGAGKKKGASTPAAAARGGIKKAIDDSMPNEHHGTAAIAIAIANNTNKSNVGSNPSLTPLPSILSSALMAAASRSAIKKYEKRAGDRAREAAKLAERMEGVGESAFAVSSASTSAVASAFSSPTKAHAASPRSGTRSSSRVAGSGASSSSSSSKSAADTAVLLPGLSDEQAARIRQAIASQRAQRAAYENREKAEGTKKLLAGLRWLHPAEAAVALNTCNGNDDEAATHLREKIHDVRHTAALLFGRVLTPAEEGTARTISAHSSSSETYHNSGGRGGLSKWVRRPRRMTDPNAPPIDRKLRLDDALSKADTMEGWSEARRRAYAQREENPNAYYYRFNDPGESQKGGKWTDEEEALFFKRMAEVGVAGKWGVFAMSIPGRVGYQCSNFYRLLLEQGRVTDDRYEFDSAGRAHMKRQDGSVRGKAGHDGEEMFSAPPDPAIAALASGAISASVAPKPKKEKPPPKPKPEPKPKPPKKETEKKPATKKRKKKREDDGGAAKRPRFDESEPIITEINPLPGFQDIITQNEVVRPFMSPTGHVLGYATWLRLLNLEPKNTCPFTNQKLTRRQLQPLTEDNIEQYRSKIRFES